MVTSFRILRYPTNRQSEDMDEQPSIQSGDDGSYYYYDYDAEIVPCNDTYLCMRRVSDTEVIRYYIRN